MTSTAPKLQQQALQLTTGLSSGPEARADFDVRRFHTTEAISTLFRVEIEARHPDPWIDFDRIVGKPARFVVHAADLLSARSWTGIVSELTLDRALADEEGLCSYKLVVVPQLWLLTQRRDYRIFQYLSDVEIVTQVLGEWDIRCDLRLDSAAHKKRKYRVQYAETDYELIYRLLADAGVTFFFEEDEEGSLLVLTDRPQSAEPLDHRLLYHDSVSLVARARFATSLKKSQRVRPNRITLRDRDYRRDASFALEASAAINDNNELELFYYPESFNFVTDSDGSSDTADDRGAARTDPKEGERRARIDLEARRNDRQTIELESNDTALRPGVTFAIENHPADDVNFPNTFLVVESQIGGRFDTPVRVHVEATHTRYPYRAALAPKPRIIGVESATVVGPPGEEIHCDEFGRVRVYFHWDRRGARDERTSCWIPVSQTWGGAGYGGMQIPRVGQEVLVEFLNGDPDRPIITGRVFTAVNKVPHALPKCKTMTVLKGCSTGGTGGANEINFNDEGGNEHMYICAEKNKDTLVKNDDNTKVGSNQGLKVVGMRNIYVKGPQSRNVGGNLCDVVGGSMVVDVTGKTTVTSDGGYELSSPKAISISSDQQIVLKCGSSMIIINPADITVQSPYVAINPGELLAEQAASTGAFPQPPDDPGPPPEAPKPANDAPTGPDRGPMGEDRGPQNDKEMQRNIDYNEKRQEREAAQKRDHEKKLEDWRKRRELYVQKKQSYDDLMERNRQREGR